MHEYNRRDFLRNAALGSGVVLLGVPIDSSAKGAAHLVNEGLVYDIAKKVWDLSREAWHPERYQPNGTHSGVIGVLNIGSKERGHYLKIMGDYLRESESLSLTAVDDINQEITKEVDGYFANLGLEYYVPPMDDIVQSGIKEIQKNLCKTTSVLAALFAIWEKKIIPYAKEHKLPVLRLDSAFEGLGSLYSAGIQIGREPQYGGGLRDFTDFKPEMQKRIIEETYTPLLTKAMPPLEKEVKRIYRQRSEEDSEEKRLAKLALEKSEEAQRILEYLKK